MRRTKIVFTIMMITILTCANIVYSRASYDTEYISISNPKSNDLSLSNFIGFNQYVDSSYMTGTNTSSEVTISGSYALTDSKEYIGYMYRFDSYGNCSEVDLEIGFDYFYNGSMLRAFGVTLGSDYEEGTPDFAVDKRVCVCQIGDAWVATDARCSLIGYPNGEKEIYEIDSHESEGSIVFKIKRDASGLYCAILKNSIVIIEQRWLEDIYRPINYIALWGSITPVYTEYSTGIFKTIDTELKFGTFIPTLKFSSKISYLLFTGIIIELLAIFFIKRKKPFRFWSK